jgi:hypothetical protein
VVIAIEIASYFEGNWSFTNRIVPMHVALSSWDGEVVGVFSIDDVIIKRIFLDSSWRF